MFPLSSQTCLWKTTKSKWKMIAETSHQLATEKVRLFFSQKLGSVCVFVFISFRDEWVMGFTHLYSERCSVMESKTRGFYGEMERKMCWEKSRVFYEKHIRLRFSDSLCVELLLKNTQHRVKTSCSRVFPLTHLFLLPHSSTHQQSQLFIY